MFIFELLLNRPADAMIPDDNNARGIIRYFMDVQKRAKFLGVKIVGTLGTIKVLLPSYPVNKCILLYFTIETRWKIITVFSVREKK
jgi:hypothetical protein